MRKSVYALAAVLALGSSLSLTTGAFARGGGHFGGHMAHFGGVGPGAHFGHMAHFGGVGPGAHFGGVGHGPHFGGVGHGRHFWHGRWWDYGVGPCWAWSDDDGEYVWVCD
jgi:hypothetical protein